MPDVIRLLKDAIANQIAAGEVVQRPASVVKELLENAIDAGANQISLYIKDSGKTLIQVADNGFGMSETDARLCFERHATSKIKNSEDLFNIKTKGFRGEALASIAAIAQIELKTKNEDSELGTQINIEASKVIGQESIAFNKGCTICVKNLFYNIPARRKFLKSDQIELKHIIDEFLRIAIPHHDINFKLIHNNKEIYNIKKSNLAVRIASLLNEKNFETFVSINEASPIVKIKGFVKKPKFCKKSSPERYFFINNRFFRSTYFNHAINSAYSGLISTEQNPSFFIFIESPLDKIDINIHPTKTEVKFEDEKSIYAVLNSIVRHAIGKFSLEPLLNFEHNTIPELPYNQYKSKPTPPKIEVDREFNPFKNEISQEEVSASISLHQQLKNTTDAIIDNSIIEPIKETIKPLIKTVSQAQNILQLNNKYLVTTVKSGLLIFNQHRVHYRVIYDLLMAKDRSFLSQNLLIPKTILIPNNQAIFFEQAKGSFQDIGIILSDLDNEKHEAKLLSIPTLIKESNAINTIEEYLANAHHQNDTTTKYLKESITKKIAKSSAVKTGESLTYEEQEFILNQFFSSEHIKLCPDNQPIFMELSTDHLKNNIG